MDDDNEVRDRATFYLNVLEQKQKALNAGYILNGNVEAFQNKAACFLPKVPREQTGSRELEHPSDCHKSVNCPVIA